MNWRYGKNLERLDAAGARQRATPVVAASPPVTADKDPSGTWSTSSAGHRLANISIVTPPSTETVRRPPIQPKLTVSQPNDKYEQEADRVADQVMRMPDPKLQRQPDKTEEEETVQAKPLADQITPLVQRQEEAPEEEEEQAQPKLLQREVDEEEEEPVQGKPLQRQPEEEEEPVQAKSQAGESIQRMCPECEGETVQRQAAEEEDETLQAKSQAGETPAVGPGIVSRMNGLKGSGQPLNVGVRSFFEPRFGHDFSHARVHVDGKANQLARSVNARAFTLGKNVVFGSGEYQPHSKEGKRLIAHELTHVVQQSATTSQWIARQPVSPLGGRRLMRATYPGCEKATTGIDDSDIVIDQARTSAGNRLKSAGKAAKDLKSTTLSSLDRHFHCPSVSDIKIILSNLAKIQTNLSNVPVSCTRDKNLCVRNKQDLPGKVDDKTGALQLCPYYFSSGYAAPRKAGAFLFGAAVLAGANKPCYSHESCYDDFMRSSVDMLVNPESYRMFILEMSGLNVPKPKILPCHPLRTSVDVIVPPDAINDPHKIKLLDGYNPIPKGSTFRTVYVDRGDKYFIYDSRLPGSRSYLPGEPERYYFLKGIPR